MVEQILNCFFFKDLLKFYDLVEKMLLSNQKNGFVFSSPLCIKHHKRVLYSDNHYMLAMPHLIIISVYFLRLLIH